MPSSNLRWWLDKLDKDMLIRRIKSIMDSHISLLVSERVRGFLSIDRDSPEEVMRELAFCILTANYRADRVLEIDAVIGDKYMCLSPDEIRCVLRELGYRFPNKRSIYIVEARRHINDVIRIINKSVSTGVKREMLVKIIKGFGYKEASHFLRNIGFLDVAIIDRHIMRILRKYGYITREFKLNRGYYIALEKIIFGLSDAVGVSPGELDLYLWYMSTGKVLK